VRASESRGAKYKKVDLQPSSDHSASKSRKIGHLHWRRGAAPDTIHFAHKVALLLATHRLFLHRCVKPASKADTESDNVISDDSKCYIDNGTVFGGGCKFNLQDFPTENRAIS
jgi:hypothetical protein